MNKLILAYVKKYIYNLNTLFETRSNISGETWKKLCSDAPHPNWMSLRGSAEKNGRNSPNKGFAKLVASYPRRLEAVIAAKGAE